MSARGWSSVTHPATYVTWCCLVMGALFGGYFVDPYVFGLATFLAAALSCLVGAVGLAVVTFSSSPDRKGKGILLGALALTAAAIAFAFRILGGFRWA